MRSYAIADSRNLYPGDRILDMVVGDEAVVHQVTRDGVHYRFCLARDAAGAAGPQGYRSHADLDETRRFRMVRSDPYIEHCRQKFADLAEMPPWADRVVTEHVEKSRSGVENTSDHDVTPTWWRNAIDIDRVARAFARACRAGVVVSVFADAHQMRVVVYHAGAATTRGALADIRRAIEETPSHSAAVQSEVVRRESDRRVTVQPDYPDDHWPEGKRGG